MRSPTPRAASSHDKEPAASERRANSPVSAGGNDAPDYLQQLVRAWHEEKLKGIYSVCSAHPWVLEAAMDQAVADDSPLLIEATSNQVNHLGGYTDMTPADFRRHPGHHP